MATMRVILTEEVTNLGDAGEVVTVKAGFGRNYLLPQGKAMLATEGRVKEIEHKKRVIEEKEKKEIHRFVALGDALAKIDLTFSMFASDEGRLFGSVTNADIADRANAQGTLDFELDRRQVVLEEPLKRLGVFNVPVRLHADVEVEIEVRVERGQE